MSIKTVGASVGGSIANESNIDGLKIDATGYITAEVTPPATDNTKKIASTSWLKLGLLVSLGGSAGYLKLPTWLGGLMIQWGTDAGVTNGASARPITFPIPFPTAVVTILNSNGDSSASLATPHVNGTGASLTGYNAVWAIGSAGIGAGVGVRTNWIAIGS